MSDLAFNLNGDSFEVPANAVGWRVRRMKAKGAPEVVYGRNGLPLVVPLEADIDDVRAEVGGAAGRYRFDPVDDSNKPIEGAPAGYVFVHDASAPAAVVQSATTLGSPSDSIVIEAMRMNAEIARTVVDRFPQMMEAAAVLLRAADGAGLPARPGMALEDEEEDEQDAESEQQREEPPAKLDVGALLTQAAPLFLAFASGKLKMPDLASMFDWSKAAKKGAASRKAQAENAEQASEQEPVTTEEETTVEEQLKSDPSAMSHFVAIMKELSPAEAMLAGTLLKELSATDRSTWFNELKVMSVKDAAHKVRAALSTNKVLA